ncbi:hypothetical protein H7J87_24420 [Mycolicibacterium wolinskyi]|uniref:Transmembrane protein n=1 Tax=Mycolicibacterium wolinskyi TaxID=59750 RepID=A0A1X2EZW0_9MYCO|nr:MULTISPECIES: hypothetical protein [Mycolicibacterium]MCV7288474.1 hypothetical protein [Mycolicibacterium wolinskyi]MCV7295696.1 hypothetical protein [Mycolicibacterium goodii]ORX11714.1 hypothetical protein AWC31_34130 [Mycolicibacterium wolinskyi]
MRHATPSLALAGALVLPLVAVPPDADAMRTEVRAVQPAAVARYAPDALLVHLGRTAVTAVPPGDQAVSGQLANATSAATSVDWRALISTITSTAAAVILAPVVVAFVGLAWVISQIQNFFYNRENATPAALPPTDTPVQAKRNAPTEPAAVDEQPTKPRTAKSSAKPTERELTKPAQRAPTPRPVVRESLGDGERLRVLAPGPDDRRSTTRHTAADDGVTKSKSTPRAASPAAKSSADRDSDHGERDNKRDDSSKHHR